MVDFWMEGVDQRLFGLSIAALPEKIQESNPQLAPPRKQGDRHSKNSKVTTQALLHGVSGVSTTVVCLFKDNK